MRAPSPPTLAHESTIPVLGVPVRLRTNARGLIGAFESALGWWRVMEVHPERLSDASVEGRLLLVEGSEGDAKPIPVAYDVSTPGRLVISSPGSRVRADASARAFEGHVTRELMRDGEHFRYKVLEAAVLSVVTHLDRQPVHASVVVRDGTALLLAGPSGTGKSTLSYAAARSGLEVLAEDTVFVQLDGGLRLWSMPGFVNLPAEARRHFAELEGAATRLLPTGKKKIRLSLGELGAAPAVPFVERAGICIVERSPGGEVSCERLGPAAVEAALRHGGEPGFDLFDARRGALAAALAPGGGWKLTLSSRPEEAIPVLHRLLDQVDARLGRSSSS